jgi:NAD(P)-dependent dehydrogenase (short-subunit alcohol dehydrogenase family)
MRVWLITGAAGGLGRAFAAAALGHGDAVALAARDVERVGDLARSPNALGVELDVTDRGAVARVVEAVCGRFGRIDVLVNNAGYGLHGAVEEIAPEEVRAIIEVNLLGALWVTQAVAPVMRAQGSGHMLAVSSAAGVTGFPLVGAYSATKFGLEGLYECLALELAPFGVRVTILEPSDFRTGFRDSCRKRASPLAVYEERFAESLDALSTRHTGREAGDPASAARALLELLDHPDPPLRLALGNRAHELAVAHHLRALEEWRAHERIARSADQPAGSEASAR